MKNTKLLRQTWRNWKQSSKEDYMKKWMIMMLALSLFAPAFAGDNSKAEGPAPKQRQEVKAGPDKAKREEMRKERKERDEQFKKTREQVEKLVKEYKKAKPGSKKAEKAKAEFAEAKTYLEKLIPLLSDSNATQKKIKANATTMLNYINSLK